MTLERNARRIVFGVIGLVIVLTLAGALYPVLTAAGDSLQTSGMPQADNLATGGVAWTIFGVAVFVAAIVAILAFLGKREKGM